MRTLSSAAFNPKSPILNPKPFSFSQEDAVVSSVHDVKAIMIGTSNGRFKAEINFDAEVLARRCMNKVSLTLI